MKGQKKTDSLQTSKHKTEVLENTTFQTNVKSPKSMKNHPKEVSEIENAEICPFLSIRSTMKYHGSSPFVQSSPGIIRVWRSWLPVL